MTDNSLGIYIHIPFCERKCRYCDFLSFSADDREKEKYADALIGETDECECEGQSVDTVFFGGGTPTVLPTELTLKIMEKIREKFNVTPDAEITTECNPKTADKEKLTAYKKAGFNRISIGLQSAREDELKVLGRIHDFKDFTECFSAAREAGFENINIDLMMGLPGQDFKIFSETLDKVTKFDPEHISVYSLILEEGTPLEKNIENFDPLPNEDEERKIYHGTVKALEDKGFHRYEISNFAKKGYECRHNLKYWELKDYRGFGIGAASFLKGKRFSNTKDIGKYMSAEDVKKLREDIHTPDQRELMGEFMFLGLRKTDGIRVSDFRKLFRADIEDVFGEVINKQMREKTLKKTPDGFALTDRGIDVSNFVLADYV